MQSISIRNLGPIKEFDYEIKDLTLLIGAQGSGKSTIAKAVYFFQTIGGDIAAEMNGLLKEPRMEFSWENLSKNIAEKFRKHFEKEYLQNLELIRFQFKQAVSLSLSRLDGGLVVEFSPDFFRLIDEIRTTFLTHTSILEGDPSSQDKRVRGLAISEAVLNRNSEIEAALGLTRLNTFIPAGRARYSLFEDRFAYLTGTRKNPITDQFINEIEFARGFLDSILKNEDARIAHNVDMAVFSLGKEILGGELRRVNEVDRFFFSDDHSLPVDAISSGQQEALWVVNILLAIFTADTRNFLVIEEPEAHLYPKAQFLLCKLIALVLRLNHAFSIYHCCL
jgi:ABC-type oligopeptide transport system ATPase subunit